MNTKRITRLNEHPIQAGPIVYWMSRDQRAEDNWALFCAQKIALKKQAPLVVMFCVTPEFLSATRIHYHFMFEGLKEVEARLRTKNIEFVMLTGNPAQEIPQFVKRKEAGALITDFDPLKIKRTWKEKILSHITCACLEVDAHNIVPCRIASQKQEYGAYTLRPKIKKLLPEFLREFDKIQKQPTTYKFKPVDWSKITNTLTLKLNTSQENFCRPGAQAAHKTLKKFIREKLNRYTQDRNDPNKDGTSHLSAYLHFGHIAAQRVALEVIKSRASATSKAAFLEELIVRKELADNFCFYNKNYDTVAGFPQWAQKTLREHKNNPHPYVYSLKEFESGLTHDPLWNAAQQEMLKKGRMHGYMRMYWAKKILEWSPTPTHALKTAIYLNDTYELDGRDPNGYTGIAWAIGGVHDRPWPTRPIFGTVRFMSYNGCASKFDVRAYIEKIKRVDRPGFY